MSQDPSTNAPISDSSWTSGEDVVAHGRTHLHDDKRAAADDVEGHFRGPGGWSTQDTGGGPGPAGGTVPADSGDDVEGHFRGPGGWSAEGEGAQPAEGDVEAHRFATYLDTDQAGDGTDVEGHAFRAWDATDGDATGGEGDLPLRQY